MQGTIWQGCSLVNLLHIFRTSFYKTTYGGLPLNIWRRWEYVSYYLRIVIPDKPFTTWIQSYLCFWQLIWPKTNLLPQENTLVSDLILTNNITTWMHLTREALGMQAYRKFLLQKHIWIEMKLGTTKIDMNPIMKSRSKLRASEPCCQTLF